MGLAGSVRLGLNMARFRVNKLYRLETIVLSHEIYTPVWWKPWKKEVFTRKFEDRLGGHAVLIVNRVVVRELRGKVDKSSYEFECEAPDGYPEVICFHDTVCEGERLS